MTKPPSIIVAELLAKLSEAERQRDRLAELVRHFVLIGDAFVAGGFSSKTQLPTLLEQARAALASLDK